MIRRRFLGLSLVTVVAGCGMAPQPQLVLPAVSPAKARLIVYRMGGDPYDGLQWTRVSLNGVRVGDSGPGTVFYRDVAPGTYEISALSDKLYPDQFKTIAIADGSTTFVRIETAPSWGQDGVLWQGNTFVVAIVDPAIGQYQIGALRLMLS